MLFIVELILIAIANLLPYNLNIPFFYFLNILDMFRLHLRFIPVLFLKSNHKALEDLKVEPMDFLSILITFLDMEAVHGKYYKNNREG